jgi:hypothetical protein
MESFLAQHSTSEKPTVVITEDKSSENTSEESDFEEINPGDNVEIRVPPNKSSTRAEKLYFRFSL